MFSDILQFFQSLGLFINGIVDLVTSVGDLVVQLITGVLGLFQWVVVALDVSRELNFVVPFDLATCFSMMTLVSVIFVVFGRIK